MICLPGKVKTLLTIPRVILLVLFLIICLLSAKSLKSYRVLAQTYTNDPFSIDYSSAKDPNVNPNLHTFDPSWDDGRGYYDANHPLDPRRPCFTYLFNKNSSPTLPPLAQTYKINEIPGIDFASSWSGANAVSFGVQSQVYLPPSGYHIDQAGHQASILYLDNNSITVSYTASGTIAIGYVITIHRLQVNPELIRLYQEYQSRGKLVAIGALQLLGTASNNTIFYLRDTGAILDLRWKDDWWTCTNQIDTREVPPDEIGKGERILFGICSNSYVESGILRPDPCYNCEYLIPDPTDSCAQPMIISRSTTVSCNALSGNRCDNDYIKTDSWDVSLTLDTSNTKVPFAGWRDIDKRDDRSTNANTYLTDYFEGTALYDGKFLDPETDEGQKTLSWETGVYRRLAPQELQDQHRKNLILKGYDYEIYDGKNFTKDNPVKLSEWAKKPQPYPDGYFPPDKNDPNYLKNYVEWEKTKWGILWTRIPLFTREDAPGIITLTVEHNPGTLTVSGGVGRQIDAHSAEFSLAVPHLARLFESTNALQKLLLPTIKGENPTHTSSDIYDSKLSSSKITSPVIAQARTESIESGEVLSVQDSCRNDTQDFSCSKDKVVEDYNYRTDPVCCDINTTLSFDNYKTTVSSDEYNNRCTNPSCTRCLPGRYTSTGLFIVAEDMEEIDDGTCQGDDRKCFAWSDPVWEKSMTRKVDVQLKLPYLEKIREQLIDTQSGVFSLFKPKDLEEFPSFDAKSGITYQVSGASVLPNPGEVYFPYLGGIQQTKKCISEQLLTPSELRNKAINWCDWGNSYQFNDAIAFEFSCSGQRLSDMNINPILDEMVSRVSAQENVDKEVLYGILRVETGLTYFNNPQSNNYCAPNYCAAQGPMQILNGWQNANCDPQRGTTCGNYCDPNTKLIKEGSRSAFDTWKNYGCSGNICDLGDSLACAAKILKGKAGVSELRLSNKEAVAKAVRRYHGDSCSLSNEIECCAEAGKRWPHLCGNTYCGYVFWFLGL
jgi:hypothetical protein